jgi:hypothetical protein
LRGGKGRGDDFVEASGRAGEVERLEGGDGAEDEDCFWTVRKMKRETIDISFGKGVVVQEGGSK